MARVASNDSDGHAIRRRTYCTPTADPQDDMMYLFYIVACALTIWAWSFVSSNLTATRSTLLRSPSLGTRTPGCGYRALFMLLVGACILLCAAARSGWMQQRIGFGTQPFTP